MIFRKNQIQKKSISVAIIEDPLPCLLPCNLKSAMGMKKEKSKKSKGVEEEIDYAAAADTFADLSDRESGDGDDDENDEDNDELAGDASDDSNGESDNNGTDDEEADVVDSEEDDEDDDEEDDEAEEEDDEEEENGKNNILSNAFAGTEPCTFDMHNLLAINSHQMDTSKMYMKKAGKLNDEEDITIPPESLEVAVNEKYLLEKAATGRTQLIAALWQLPIESSDIGPMVSLPIHDGSKIPRQLVRCILFAAERFCCAAES